jgi:hypothetical protein
MMEKKKFYIAVETGQILEDRGASGYELEIEATPAEVADLENLFDKKDRDNFETFVDPHLPNKWDEVGSDVQDYNTHLYEVYEMLYKLGTQSTKEHIEQAEILSKLKNNKQNYDFG